MSEFPQLADVFELDSPQFGLASEDESRDLLGEPGGETVRVQVELGVVFPHVVHETEHEGVVGDVLRLVIGQACTDEGSVESCPCEGIGVGVDVVDDEDRVLEFPGIGNGDLGHHEALV